ncbi:MAG: HD domain-containing phosphohydrolase [Thermodesulforhabdaceae bacterium]
MAKFYNISEILCALSYALDLADPALSNHHLRVCYIATELAKHLGLRKNHLEKVFVGALLHDIGFLSSKERLEALEFENFSSDACFPHCWLGYNLLKNIPYLEDIAEIVLNHHKSFEQNGKDENVSEPYIIHVADRIDALIVAAYFKSKTKGDSILKYTHHIVDKLQEKKSHFHPYLIESFKDLSARESFWLDLVSPELFYIIKTQNDFIASFADLAEFEKIAGILSKIIDYRTPFTVVHSSGVTAISTHIAELIGFSEEETLMIKIAGLLHDIGKIVVPTEILNKPGSLTPDETAIIKTHTYYTYKILNRIQGIDPIHIWAAFHHERLNGKGYPFKKRGNEIPLGARIVAIADVLSAITEDRPYRKGMSEEMAKKVMEDMVKSGALDKDIYGLVLANFDDLSQKRKMAQEIASREYLSIRKRSSC